MDEPTENFQRQPNGKKRQTSRSSDVLKEVRLPGLRLKESNTAKVESSDSKRRSHSPKDNSGELIAPITIEIGDKLKSFSYTRAYLELVEEGNVKFEKNISPGTASGGSRYSLGLELTITALIAIAGIRRRRGDLSASTLTAITLIDEEKDPSASDTQNTSASNPVNTPETNSEAGTSAGSEPESLARTLEKAAARWAESCTDDSMPGSNYLYGNVLRRPTVLVTLADTLVSIAERHYHDRLLGWLIADLNRSRLSEKLEAGKRIIEIQNGQMIELPVWEDVVEFYQHRPKAANADNLITIVLKRGAHRQKLEEELAKLLESEFDGEAGEALEGDE
ncbi:MAG: hypothetical protein K2Z81_02500 [Cyanobacteria bacterium]|nr:hypothetical protein [Cyanobacteriota bacterium]